MGESIIEREIGTDQEAMRGSTLLASRAVKNDSGVGFWAAPATPSGRRVSLPGQ